MADLPGFLRDPNLDLRQVHNSERLLGIYCHETRRRRLVALVVQRAGRDTLLVPAAAISFEHAAEAVQVGCRCHRRAHTIAVDQVHTAVDRLRHRPPKGRTVDVRNVSPWFNGPSLTG